MIPTKDVINSNTWGNIEKWVEEKLYEAAAKGKFQASFSKKDFPRKLAGRMIELGYNLKHEGEDYVLSWEDNDAK